ncbi:50S ribosomal protein L23 [Candidatus Woesearchaeota archaeon]|nr:50S ribosomal protein L23 [Candidatus Woesearchaeota archaeon]
MAATKRTEKGGEPPAKKEERVPIALDPYTIIKHPLSTEKGVRLMEAENKLLFVIDANATKRDVKTAIEKLYAAKVRNVNTFIQYGQKRAYVTFSAETPAINVATNLGLI